MLVDLSSDAPSVKGIASQCQAAVSLGCVQNQHTLLRPAEIGYSKPDSLVTSITVLLGRSRSLRQSPRLRRHSRFDPQVLENKKVEIDAREREAGRTQLCDKFGREGTGLDAENRMGWRLSLQGITPLRFADAGHVAESNRLNRLCEE